METNFNFKSQPCTSREQSERLLALGLKKETADVTTHYEYGVATIIGMDYPYYVQLHTELGHTDKFFENIFPAWSLGRLIKLMPKTIIMHFPTGEAPDTPIDIDVYAQDILSNDDSIVEAVSIIEWLIKDGYFNKEYLV